MGCTNLFYFSGRFSVELEDFQELCSFYLKLKYIHFAVDAILLDPIDWQAIASLTVRLSGPA